MSTNAKVRELTRAYHAAVDAEQRAVSAMLRVVHEPARLPHAQAAVDRRREQTRKACHDLDQAIGALRRPLTAFERKILRDFLAWRREHRRVMG